MVEQHIPMNYFTLFTNNISKRYSTLRRSCYRTLRASCGGILLYTTLNNKDLTVDDAPLLSTSMYT